MNTGRRAWHAFLVFAPWLFIFAIAFLVAFTVPRYETPDDFLRIAPNLLQGILVLFAATLALTLIGLIFCLVHLVNDKRSRPWGWVLFWLILLLSTGNIGQMAYFFARVRKHLPDDAGR
jgi:hypothetical protein